MININIRKYSEGVETEKNKPVLRSIEDIFSKSFWIVVANNYLKEYGYELGLKKLMLSSSKMFWRSPNKEAFDYSVKYINRNGVKKSDY